MDIQIQKQWFVITQYVRTYNIRHNGSYRSDRLSHYTIRETN